MEAVPSLEKTEIKNPFISVTTEEDLNPRSNTPSAEQEIPGFLRNQFKKKKRL